MKKLLLFSLAAVLTISSYSIRPRHVAYPYAQSDGTSLMVYKNGDGFFAFATSLDNLVLVQNEAGDLCYAMIRNGRLVASSWLAHEEGARSEAEKQFLADHPLSVAEAAVITSPRHHAARPRVIGVSTGDGLGKYGQSGTGGVNSIGKYKIPVIMAQFPDLKFKNTTTVAKMTRYYNEKGYHDEPLCVGSARDYFLSQSRGMFDPEFEVVGIVTLPKSYKEYGGNVGGRDKNVTGMVKDAVAEAVKQNVKFQKFVVNGAVPLVAVLYAGRGEATEPAETGSDYVWPQEFDVNTEMSGFYVNSYFVGNELDHSGELMGMGIFCHEFGHALGLPDFYPTDQSYSGDDAFGAWSIMDGGAYVNKCRAPEGYTAYERSVMGWLKLPELKDPQSVTLDTYDTENGQPAVLIRNDSRESFILENRQPGTWYPSQQGSGLLLMRIAYNRQEWNWNIPNNIQSKKRAMVVAASNRHMYYDALPQDLYGNGVDEIKTFKLFNGSLMTSKPVTNITKVGKKIKFSFMAGAVSRVGFDTIYSEVFDKNLGEFTVDNVHLSSGVTRVWRFAPFKAALASARIGSKNLAAESWLISPVIDLSNYKEPKLYFDHTAKLFDGSNDQLTVWVRENASDVWKQVTGIDYPVEYMKYINATIPGFSLSDYAGKSVQVGFKYTSTASAAATWGIRNFLVCGKKNPTSIGTISTSTAPTVVYDLQGRRVQNPTKGLYIVNGKKVMF